MYYKVYANNKVDIELGPLSYHDIRVIHYNTSFPEDLGQLQTSLNEMGYYEYSNRNHAGWAPQWYEKIVESDIQIDRPNNYVISTHTLQTLSNQELENVLPDQKRRLVDEIRNVRWQKETGGVTIAPGVVVRTDEVSQAKLTGMVNLFANDPTLTSIDWEAQPGVWTTIDGNTAISIGIAVGRHIQACFTHARTLSEQIQAANTVNAINSIDITAGWPS